MVMRPNVAFGASNAPNATLGAWNGGWARSVSVEGGGGGKGGAPNATLGRSTTRGAAGQGRFQGVRVSEGGLQRPDVRWAVGVRVPNCVWEHRPPVGEGGDHLLWLRDPTGESWAVARYSGAPGPRLIRQYGPRRLWDEVEAAFRAWAAEGKPPVDAWRAVVTPENAER
ncbi:hypothetical protein GCM10023192_56010 [Amycolatopsis samaneae]